MGAFFGPIWPRDASSASVLALVRCSDGERYRHRRVVDPGTRGSYPRLVWRVFLLLVHAVTAVAADPVGTPASRTALAGCEQAGTKTGDARAQAYRDSLARADAAISADDGDGLAHFAAFCALGGLMKSTGVSFAMAGQLRRLRREVDRALELAPEFADALAGKGSLLLHVPRLLGGDPAEAERLLRQALAIDPDYITPRLALVDALRARGALDEARVEAMQALVVAQRKGSADSARAAREALTTLGPDPENP